MPAFDLLVVRTDPALWLDAPCTDGGGVPRAPALFHYQVRVSCNASTEGP